MYNSISQKINIGDRITYTQIGGTGKRYLHAGVVVGFTDKKVKCYFHSWGKMTLAPDFLTVVSRDTVG